MSQAFSHDEIYLRPVESNDLPLIFKGLSHPQVIQYYGVSYQTIEDTKEQMDWYQNLVAQQKGQWWVIQRRKDDEWVGACGFHQREKFHRRVEVGFWLLPEFWGQGLMAKALPLIIDYAFTQWSIDRIEAWVESQNIASKNLLIKLNFQLEGRLKRYEFKDGQSIDVEVYALLK